jgi:hypothetical protein
MESTAATQCGPHQSFQPKAQGLDLQAQVGNSWQTKQQSERSEVTDDSPRLLFPLLPSTVGNYNCKKCPPGAKTASAISIENKLSTHWEALYYGKNPPLSLYNLFRHISSSSYCKIVFYVLGISLLRKKS